MFETNTLPTSDRGIQFITLAQSPQALRRLRLLVESLRRFGGQLSETEFWVFYPTEADQALRAGIPEQLVIRWQPLEFPTDFPRFFFATKVYTCALAERLCARDTRSLVWLDPGCLVLQPPQRLDLLPGESAAFRPVHIRNIGSLRGELLDDFWQAVYRRTGVEEALFSIQSFVDGQTLRPYFNTHLFAIDPSLGILQKWWEVFQALVADSAFQVGACQDELHQIFLHQAALSALVIKWIKPDRIRTLPPEYSYPLHLHTQLPGDRRINTLNNLVCPVYEDDLSLADLMKEMEIQEPLRAWLEGVTS